MPADSGKMEKPRKGQRIFAESPGSAEISGTGQEKTCDFNAL